MRNEDFMPASELSKEQLDEVAGSVTYRALVHLNKWDVEVRGYIKGDEAYVFHVTETKNKWQEALLGMEFPLNEVSLGPRILEIAPTEYSEARI